MRKVTSFAMKVNGYQLIETKGQFGELLCSFDGVCYQSIPFPAWLKVIDTYYDEFEYITIVKFDVINPIHVE